MNRKIWSGRFLMAVAFTLTACAISVARVLQTGEEPPWFSLTLTAIIAFYFGSRPTTPPSGSSAA